MANTLIIGKTITHQRGGNHPTPIIAQSGVRLDQTNEGQASGIQNLSTTAANLNLGNLTTIGFGSFENLDANDDIELGWDDSGFVRACLLKPGGIYDIPLDPARTWQGRATSGTCLLKYIVHEA